METIMPKIHSVSTEPSKPVVGRTFKLIIEGKNFGESPSRLLYAPKERGLSLPLRKGIPDELSLFVDSYLERGLRFPNVGHIERSEKRVVSLELVKEAGIYYVSICTTSTIGDVLTAEGYPYGFKIAVEHPGQETPGAGGEDKPARQGLKSSLITLKEVLYIVGAIASIVALWFSLPNYVKDFVKDAFPSKDILYLIVINAFQILGLLAVFATLIMFVDWLRNKR